MRKPESLEKQTFKGQIAYLDQAEARQLNIKNMRFVSLLDLEVLEELKSLALFKIHNNFHVLIRNTLDHYSPTPFYNTGFCTGDEWTEFEEVKKEFDIQHKEVYDFFRDKKELLGLDITKNIMVLISYKDFYASSERRTLMYIV